MTSAPAAPTSAPPAGGGPVPHAGPGDSDISLFELLTPLVRRWRLVVGAALLAAVVTAVALVLTPNAYTATATFTPESPSGSALGGGGGNLAALSGLASLAGLGSALGGGSVSPEFFQKLISSEEVMRSALRTPFDDPTHPGTRRALLDLLRAKGDTPAERMEDGVKRLRKRVQASADKPTSIVTLRVDMRDPQLAAAVANRLLELLNQFNLERRQTQSHAQRSFTEQRLHVAERELRDAEARLQAFLTANRSFSESPSLLTQQQRLARDARVRQEVYLTLTQAFEQARIAEVRDTPVLTVIDPAIPPVKKSGPKRGLGVIIALIVGTVVGTVLAYVAATRHRVHETPGEDYLRFREAWRESFGRRPSI